VVGVARAGERAEERACRQGEGQDGGLDWGRHGVWEVAALGQAGRLWISPRETNLGAKKRPRSVGVKSAPVKATTRIFPMRTQQGTPIRRDAYQPLAYQVETVDLDFVLDSQATVVTNRMRCVRNPEAAAGRSSCTARPWHVCLCGSTVLHRRKGRSARWKVAWRSMWMPTCPAGDRDAYRPVRQPDPVWPLSVAPSARPRAFARSPTTSTAPT
jgi:hypothetical protein